MATGEQTKGHNKVVTNIQNRAASACMRQEEKRTVIMEKGFCQSDVNMQHL
jgi:hypothetical protein